MVCVYNIIYLIWYMTIGTPPSHPLSLSIFGLEMNSRFFNGKVHRQIKLHMANSYKVSQFYSIQRSTFLLLFSC